MLVNGDSTTSCLAYSLGKIGVDCACPIANLVEAQRRGLVLAQSTIFVNHDAILAKHP